MGHTDVLSSFEPKLVFYSHSHVLPLRTRANSWFATVVSGDQS